jgi:hypothetical protein
MLARGALQGVTDASTGNQQVATGLGSDTVYQVSDPEATDTPVTANAIVSYHEYSGGQAAVDVGLGNLPTGTQAIVLDQEDWQGTCQGSPTCTPQDELDDPVGAATTAAAATMSANPPLTLIATPGLDLFDGTGTLPCTQKLYLCYLSYNMAGKMAAIPGVDVIDLQAQSLEATPGTYESFVEQASAQAKAANPNIVVLSGLSTDPNTNPQPTVKQIETCASYVFSNSYVSGFWMNIPNGSSGYAEAEQIMLSLGV